MILGAGLGTRLRPLTFELPKPAIPVLGRPVISYNLEFLHRYGVKELVVNLHRIPGIIKNRIARWGGFGGKIHYIIEPDILGTGGGLKNAASHFKGENFFIIANSDTIVDFDLRKAISFHKTKGADATMVLFPPRGEKYPRVYLDGNNRLLSIRQRPSEYSHHGFYTGVSILTPAILDLLPAGKSCLVQDGFVPAKKEGMEISCFLGDGLFLEFGTPKDYLTNTFKVLEQSGRKHGEHPKELRITPPVHISDTAIIGENVTIGPLVSIEAGAVIEDGATLQRTIVWEKGKVGKDSDIEDSIVTPSRVLKCPPNKSN